MTAYDPYEPIRDHLFLIGGYTQVRGTTGKGMIGTWHRLHNAYSTKGVNVQYQEWDSDWSQQAECVYRASDSGRNARVVIAAYSWGGGYGAVRLMWELQKRNIQVSGVILSDAVRHFGGRWAHRIGVAQGLAYYQGWHLYIPQNVAPENIFWFVQHTRGPDSSWLHGHELYWANQDGSASNAKVPNRIECPGLVHSTMDTLFGFQDKIDEVCGKVFCNAV